MSDLSNFIQTELYPAIFERVGDIFHGMNFQRYEGGWLSPFKLDGTPPKISRKDKSKITTKVPTRIFEQGDEQNSKDLITYFAERNNYPDTKEGRIEAIKALASFCRLSLPPMRDSESYRLWQEKQDRLERINAQMVAALYTDEGAATLKYLREERGYSDDFIKYAGFGFLSSSFIEELKDIFKGGSTFPRKVEDGSNPLSIPFRTGGVIRGFIFRHLRSEKSGKYMYLFTKSNRSHVDNLFGLTGLKLTGNKERDRDITIVEGFIDALRASFCGLPNVVSAGGGTIKPEALKEAKARGVERVTLLMDADSTGGDFTEKNIPIIQEEGLKCYVVSLPSPDGEKVDVDSFLRDHTGAELKQIVEGAETASLWLLYRIAEKFAPDEGKSITPKQWDKFRRKIIDLCNSPYTSPTDRDILLQEVASNYGVSEEALQEEADALKLAADKNRQRQETVALTAEAFKLANNGSAEEAISLLRAKLPDLSQMSREAEYSSLLALPTAEGIRSRFKEKPTGVKTGYVFSTPDGKQQERLFLPVGGLTYICAPTSHGKSRFLENLALQLATDGEGGDVLYFSFEEDNTAVELQLLNIYANMPLSRNNLRSLNSYYRTGGTGYFGREADLAGFKRKEEEFLSLLSSGRLRVYYKDYDSTELIEAIRYVSKQTKIKAVFVDYIQLLHTRGTRLQRREELGEMCKSLWQLATETATPIVLAAQLNREAYSPLDMASQNIAEAADIERSANTIILLWNSDFKPIPQKSSYYRSNKGEQTFTDEAKALEGRDGFQIGKAGKIYAKISKNRGGTPNMDAVFNYNGNTGFIAPNTKPQTTDKDEDTIFIPSTF